MERDKFMNPSDAKDFGIIDKILNHPPKHGDRVEDNSGTSLASRVEIPQPL